MSDVLRDYVKKAMQGLSGNKRTIFSREFIEDAYPSDEPFGSLSQFEADAATHGVRIIPVIVSSAEAYVALIG